jgi:hypothetical protein
VIRQLIEVTVTTGGDLRHDVNTINQNLRRAHFQRGKPALELPDSANRRSIIEGLSQPLRNSISEIAFCPPQIDSRCHAMTSKTQGYWAVLRSCCRCVLRICRESDSCWFSCCGLELLWPITPITTARKTKAGGCLILSTDRDFKMNTAPV